MTFPKLWRSEREFSGPFHEMSRLQRRIDRMFDEYFDEPTGRGLFRAGLPAEFEPAADVDENGSRYLFSFDLPGVKKDDVKIEVNDRMLTVSGERKEESHTRRSRERYYGSFYRSFLLPANADPEKVEASFENGVLQVAVPKSATATTKRIAVKEGTFLEKKSEKAA